MSLEELDSRLEGIKNIRSKITEAKGRMNRWSPKANCDNFVRANYHQAYKDLDSLKKELSVECTLLSEWLYETDFNLKDHLSYKTPSWILMIGVFFIFPLFIYLFFHFTSN